MTPEEIEKSTKGIEAINMLEKMLNHKRLMLKGLRRDKQLFLEVNAREVIMVEKDIELLEDYMHKLGME